MFVIQVIPHERHRLLETSPNLRTRTRKSGHTWFISVWYQVRYMLSLPPKTYVEHVEREEHLHTIRILIVIWTITYHRLNLASVDYILLLSRLARASNLRLIIIIIIMLSRHRLTKGSRRCMIWFDTYVYVDTFRNIGSEFIATVPLQCTRLISIVWQIW